MIKMLALGGVGAGVLAVGAAYVWSVTTVDTPDYTLERQDGDFEIRTYPAMALAQVTRAGSRQDAVQRSFSPLAQYIFAKGRPGEKIAMTAPVVQSPADEGWTVSFILPAPITAGNAPTPVGEVKVIDQPKRTMAAMRFSGTWSDERFNAASTDLLAWIKAQGLQSEGEVEYGYYNDPFMPAFMRRNEVLIPVSTDSDADSQT